MRYLTPITLVCIVQLGSLDQVFDFSSQNLTIFNRNVYSKYTDDEPKDAKFLILSRNKLTSSDTLIGLSAFKNIIFLNLNRNIIESLGSSLSNCKELTTLRLANNRIREVDGSAFVSNKKLKMLSLNRNKLESVNKASFSNLKSLVILNLSHNQIRTVESGTFDDLPELIEINLSNNQLTAILSTSFSNIPKLTTLKLNDNNISALADNSFDGVEQGRSVSLQRNQIKYLSDIDGVSKTRIFIRLGGNPICVCDKNVLPTTKNQQENIQATCVPGTRNFLHVYSYGLLQLSIDKCTH
ncbi:Uncharacterised protein r2_g185 [Pycnogonum litorale]